MGLSFGDQLGQRARRHGGVNDQDLRAAEQRRDWCELPDRVVTYAPEDRRRHHQRPGRAQQQRVAVGLGGRDRGRADAAATAARTMVDDCRLAPRRRHPGGEEARH